MISGEKQNFDFLRIIVCLQWRSVLNLDPCRCVVYCVVHFSEVEKRLIIMLCLYTLLSNLNKIHFFMKNNVL